MREILFRGKTSGNEWICGNLTTIGDCCFISKAMGFNKIVATETVGQFTGLTDKNGKKIFEGDICKGAWSTIFQVVYDDCYLGFRAEEKSGLSHCIDYYGIDRLEVIGNIHDTPELLKTA